MLAGAGKAAAEVTEGLESRFILTEESTRVFDDL